VITREAAHHIEFFSENIMSVFSRFTAIIYYKINQNFFGFDAVKCETFSIADNDVSKLAKSFFYGHLVN
jgi:hypothetical protein